jgi:hypothetical protein
MAGTLYFPGEGEARDFPLVLRGRSLVSSPNYQCYDLDAGRGFKKKD